MEHFTLEFVKLLEAFALAYAKVVRPLERETLVGGEHKLRTRASTSRNASLESENSDNHCRSWRDSFFDMLR